MTPKRNNGMKALSVLLLSTTYALVQIALAMYLPAGNGGMVQGVVLFLTAIVTTEKMVGVAPEHWKFTAGTIAFVVMVIGLFAVGLYVECRFSPDGCDV